VGGWVWGGARNIKKEGKKKKGGKGIIKYREDYSPLPKSRKKRVLYYFQKGGEKGKENLETLFRKSKNQ